MYLPLHDPDAVRAIDGPESGDGGSMIAELPKIQGGVTLQMYRSFMDLNGSTKDFYSVENGQPTIVSCHIFF